MHWNCGTPSNPTTEFQLYAIAPLRRDVLSSQEALCYMEQTVGSYAKVKSSLQCFPDFAA